MCNFRRSAFLAIVLSLSGCGGGSGSGEVTERGALPPLKLPPTEPAFWVYLPCESQDPGTVPPSEFDALPGGIWRGLLTNELREFNESYMAVIAEDGRFRLQSIGHTQWLGVMATAGATFTGDGFAKSGGTAWNDGTLVSEFSVAGTIRERDSLFGYWTAASGDAGCIDFAYDAELYERPSSLESIEGAWIDYDDWSFAWLGLTINSDGSFTGVNIYGCDLTGQFALIDDRFNLYEVQSTFTQIPGPGFSCISGDYTGFAYLYDTNDGSPPNNRLYVSLVAGTNAIAFNISRQ